MRLDQGSTREAFERDGFVLLESPVVPPGVVAAAERGLERLKAGEYRAGRPPEASPWNPGDPPGHFSPVPLAGFHPVNFQVVAR